MTQAPIMKSSYKNWVWTFRPILQNFTFTWRTVPLLSKTEEKSTRFVGFLKNSNYELALKRAHETLNIPKEYLPLDSFEGEGGFFII